MTDSKPFSEVIESSLQGFLAQSWQWDVFPPFGSLVTVLGKKRTIFGIVHQIQAGSMDPMRYPFAYQKTEEELRQEQPQIFEFLKTSFSCLTIGYQEKGHIHYLTAPEPTKIHTFVQHMPTELAKQFFSSDKYLHSLFGSSAQIINLDELLLAIIRQKADLGVLSPERLATFTQTFSLLTGNDYRRLKLFLQRVEPLLSA